MFNSNLQIEQSALYRLNMILLICLLVESNIYVSSMICIERMYIIIYYLSLYKLVKL